MCLCVSSMPAGNGEAIVEMTKFTRDDVTRDDVTRNDVARDDVNDESRRRVDNVTTTTQQHASVPFLPCSS